MNENKAWSVQQVFALIYHWKLYPELWDVKNKEYRCRAKKQAALRAIAAELDTTENEVYRKFHNLRTQFHQELRRIKAKIDSGGGESAYITSWKFFDAMKFITGRTNPKTVKTLRRKIRVAVSETYSPTEVSSVAGYDTETQSAAVDSDDSCIILERQETKTEAEVEDVEVIEVIENDPCIMPEFVEVSKDEMRIEEKEPNYLHKTSLSMGDRTVDEFQIFGDFVASELRSLQSRENQNKLKRMIQRAIVEISEIDDNEHF